MPAGLPPTAIAPDGVSVWPSNREDLQFLLSRRLKEQGPPVFAPRDTLPPVSDLDLCDELQGLSLHPRDFEIAEVVEERRRLWALRMVHDGDGEIAAIGRQRDAFWKRAHREVIHYAGRLHREVDEADDVGSAAGEACAHIRDDGEVAPRGESPVRMAAGRRQCRLSCTGQSCHLR